MDGQPTVDLTLPARPESLTVVRQALSGVAEVEGWPPSFLADAKIAISEACSNVVVHAYPEDTEGRLHVAMTPAGRQLCVIVRDYGSGIEPRLVDRRAGLGLGLPLIAALAAEVSFRRAETGGTEVRMVLDIPTEEAL
jgi:anti-sigma regulatory factor (Ser/Thr protein kinase)